MNNEEIEKIVESWGEGIMSYADVKGCANELAKLQTKACIDMLEKFVMWYNKRNFDAAEKVFKKHGLIPEEYVEQFKLSMEEKRG